MAERALIISDLHLGLSSSQPGKVLSLLESLKFDLLVVDGDLYNGNTDAFTPACWRLIDRLRAVHHSKDRSVVLVRGNHDPSLMTLTGQLTGIPVYDWYAWECAGYAAFAIHGHQFDACNRHPSVIVSFIIWAFTKALAKGWVSYNAERIFDKYNAEWSRDSQKVRDGTIGLAIEHQRVAAFAGHTHEALQNVLKGVQYVNTGCLLADTRSSYGWIDKEGPKLVYC
jgi:predicted phosphodiesterase